jgi:hypothetical protein
MQLENTFELRRWRLYSKLMVKVDRLTPEQMALKQEQIEMIQRGGDVLIIEEEDMIKVNFEIIHRILSLIKP